MEGYVAQKLNEFETGKISRRRLIETLTFAATSAYAAGSASAQSESPLKAQLINHVSYTCPNFKEAADWYSKVFNLEQVGPTARATSHCRSARRASSLMASAQRTCRYHT
jgi:tRNA A37 threonylcarbamoyladenosine synthetase subunit TsaC/SUA5/YrdC